MAAGATCLFPVIGVTHLTPFEPVCDHLEHISAIRLIMQRRGQDHVDHIGMINVITGYRRPGRPRMPDTAKG